MGAVGKCLGSYGSKQGQCESCPLALLCIDTAIAIDRHIDEMYDRQLEIEEMEADHDWNERQLAALLQQLRQGAEVR